MSGGGGSQPGAPTLAPGVVLDGKYEIVSLLGAGGMGEVYKARHVHLNTFRCIKLMRPSLLADDAYRQRFLREARLATSINHPNIASVHDFSTRGDGTNYMVTEFIDGTTVRQWSAAHGRFPLPLATEVAMEVLSGLAHIHRRGLLHRDISSDNIMLSFDSDERLAVKIIDLGIAKDVSVSSDTTQAGMLIGNPKYMSPEQLGELEEGEQLDARADLYCFGVVLYEMLLGVPPFVSKTPHGYIIKHLTQPPPSFHECNPEINFPPDLEAKVFKALEKKRDRRYPDARTFAEALRPYLPSGQPELTRATVMELQRTGTLSEPGEETMDSPPANRSQTELDWKKTVASDSQIAYRDYLEKHPSGTAVTEAKARLFELSLLEDVRAKERARNISALEELAVAHPSRTRVGDSVREAIARVRHMIAQEQREEDEFQKAWETGSSAAWRSFLHSYGSSSKRDRASQLLEEASGFETAVRHESETGLREFLKRWPDGRHHLDAEVRLAQIRSRVADTAFASALTADTYVALRDFLARFPNSPHTEDAQRAIRERLAFETASTLDSEDSWEEYLAEWAGDRHAPLAQRKLGELLAREEEAYARAIEARSAEAWDNFLDAFPNSRRCGRVEQHRREAQAFDEARDGGRAELEEFLRHYPEGLLTKEARRMVRQLSDEDEFAEAQRHDSAASWRLYLTSHPSGMHKREATERLEALEDEAYKRVLASKSESEAAQFLLQFPDTPRYRELQRLQAKWGEAKAIQHAIAALDRSDLPDAESWVAKVTDRARRADLERALASLREKDEWDKADAAGSASLLQGYVDRWPEGRWVAQAKKRLVKARADLREHEGRDFDAAWEKGTTAAWDEFLSKHTDSSRLAEAKSCRQEAAEFEQASGADTPKIWRAFMKAWPEGRHRLDAEVRLRAVARAR